MNNKLISVKNLIKYFPIRKGVFKRTVGWVKAVDNISFDIYNGNLDWLANQVAVNQPLP